ncbi:hypothetical protein OC25_09465 [Pedobacter kyungheensis]|uniref:Transposase IS200-like domain-containing protein n=1 Tax=Pedobacter kyungheensis TaxID=1069985 RepID=A0A0C1DKS9_9SPHI|nr:hypothetical protein [Pedobacter kyungheensis]KIA94610.1 hypothetical protein OC25_09465 [Pedobacter kyungheensis]
MAYKEHYHQKLEYGRFYHIYNRTIDKQLMFRSDENYQYFLKQYDKYLSPVFDTFAYCLLGNHFHILIKVKEESEFTGKDALGKSCHDIVAHQLQKFFQSYAMAFNKQHKRIGSLFQKPFKRTHIDSDEYLTRMIIYIHANPEKHKLITDFRNWRWSSYQRILIDRPTNLKKSEVIDWFGSKDNYIECHNENR